MNWLIGSSLRFGRLVIAAAIGLLVLGVVQLRDAKVDAFGEFMPPSVQVQTEALGLSAAEVEQLITVPLEQDLLNGVPWVDRIHSRSQPGLSAIDLVFHHGTDLYAARQMVQERLSQAHALPNVGSAPVMIEPLASTSRVAMIGMSSKSASLVEMSVLARWKIRPRLMGIPGVANVAIYGQRDRQLQVQVDPAELKARGVTLTDVIETAGNALWVSPLTFVEASTPGTGGFVEGENQRLAIQHVLPITTAKNLAEVPVEGTAPGSLRLGDVSQVIEDHQPLIGDAVGAGDPTLYLVIQRFPDANTLEVTRQIEDALHSMQPGLSGIRLDTSVYRPAGFIESAVSNVRLVAIAGLLLLMALLLLVFSSWRAALVSLLAVPVSMVAALYVLYLRGTTLTTMTLAGLAVALALVVDDAVGDVEAIRERLRRRREDGENVSVPRAVAEACQQARGTIVFAVVITLLATVPFLVMSPLTAQFTRPMVLSYALAVLISTLLALTLTPVLAAVLFRHSGVPVRPLPFERWVTRWSARGIRAFASRRSFALISLAGLAVAALLALPQLGSGSWLPQTGDGNLLLQVATAPGTSLPEMDRVTNRMAAELRTLPAVAAVGAHVGRAVTSDQLVDVNSAEIWLTLKPGVDGGAARRAVNGVALGYPGVSASLLTYSADRVAAAATGTENDLVVRIFGQDYAAMGATAQKVRAAIASVPGVRSPAVQALPQEPTVQVEVNLAEAQKYGLRPGDVRREATTLTSGLIVGNLYDDAKIFDVVVLGTPASRANLTTLGDLLIGTPAGGQVRLKDVASVSVTPQPTAIVHDGVQRSLDVVASVRGRSPADVAAGVRAAVATVPMPTEVHLQVLGNATVQQADTRRVWIYAAIVVALTFLLLQAATASWVRALVLLVVAPLGAVGGVLSAPLAGGLHSAGALAGLFAVLALSVRSSLVLVRRIRTLERSDPMAAGRPAAITAARQRALPVVRSAMAIAAVLLPMVLLGGRPGVEILRPLAVTTLGGLVTSVFVTLFVVPALCLAVPTTGPEEPSEHAATPSREPAPV